MNCEKVQEKIGYKSNFSCSYSADSPLQKRVCIIFINKYFGKYGWLKEKRVYFNVIVSENKTFLQLNAHIWVKNKWRHVFREQNVRF